MNKWWQRMFLFGINRPEAGWRRVRRCFARLSVMLLAALPAAHAVSCTTQARMTPAVRQTLFRAARTLVGYVQQGKVTELQGASIPSLASQFGGVASTARDLEPQIAHATITVNNLYRLDAADVAPGTKETDFSCGLPGSLMSVGLSFHDLPAGQYALAIVHATGVPQPQQLTLVMQQMQGKQWKLAGFFHRPMLMAGHDGLWYWTHAREYGQRHMKWNAWLYYQAAKRLLRPVNFLMSPNLAQLEHEAAGMKPAGLPGKDPMRLLSAAGSFMITSIAPTDALGPLDLEVKYRPDSEQAAQLNDPVEAKNQVMAAMVSLVKEHPELRVAFHGIWMRAEQGGASVYALELPMQQIQSEASAPAS